MLPLLEELDPERRHVGLLPLGPLEAEPEGRQWYTIEREASPEPSTFLPALEALWAWLDETLAKDGIEPNRAVVGGFSQGAVMAYSFGLAPGRPSPAAILAFSGYIPRVEGFDLDLEGRAGLPVSISRGALDPTIPVDFGREVAGASRRPVWRCATASIPRGTTSRRARSRRRGRARRGAGVACGCTQALPRAAPRVAIGRAAGRRGQAT